MTQNGTADCPVVTCDGEIPWEEDGGEVYLKADPNDDGKHVCPKCGTPVKYQGEDWEISTVYVSKAEVSA